jgi:elongation factor Ts
LKIPTTRVKELRNQSGAGVMDCKNALLEAEGDIEKALELLKQKGCLLAQKKAGRSQL